LIGRAKTDTVFEMNLFNRNVNQRTLDDMDSLSGTPETTIWTKWFGGIIVPAVTLGYGIRSCILQHCVLLGGRKFSGRRSVTELDGSEAIAMGITWMCLGLFLHFHYFWPTLKRLYIFTDLGKTVAAFGFIASLGYLFWSIMKSWV
jgi:hypothetical protein